jgi:hypothetical protein
MFRYMSAFNMEEVMYLYNTLPKSTNTVIDRWPFGLKLKSTDPGAKEEFERVVGFGPGPKNCVLEWKRVR